MTKTGGGFIIKTQFLPKWWDLGAGMKNRIPEGHWLITRAVAHRGYHKAGVPENSILAFERAMAHGYPIETDVQMTADGVLVCFHDDTLNRMTGVDKKIWDVAFADLKELKLSDSDEGIPTFAELLALVGGKVPLLIELKTQPKNQEVCDKVIELLADYEGEFAIQSFDPRVMSMVKKANPSILRGQLLERGARHENLSPIVDKMLSNGLLNVLSKPDFINANWSALPLPKRMTRGKRVLCWTVRSEEEEQKALPYVQGYVFENINPKLK